MMRTLSKKTGASYKQVVKATTGSILENTARRTYKTKLKTIKLSVNKFLSRKFKAQDGSKIRKGKDGSLVFRSSSWSSGRWIKLRSSFDIRKVDQTPNGRQLQGKLKSQINRSLREYRLTLRDIINRKKARIASSQASFLNIMKQLRIPIKSNASLGAARKAKIDAGHKRALRGSQNMMGKDSYSITISSRSRSALNPKSGGVGAFRWSFNGQVKAFETAAKKDLKTYTQKFASRNGFIVKG